MKRGTWVVHLSIGVVLAISFILIGKVGRADAQTCTQKARAVRSAAMWEGAPTFVTGRGLVYGRQVNTLPRGVLVYICQRVSVGLTFSSQTWYRVAYWNGAWSFAWVRDTALRIESSSSVTAPRPAVQRVAAASGVDLRSAAPVPPPAAPPFTPTEAPPGPPPEGITPPPLPPAPTPRRDEASLIEFYALSFVLLVLGMAAKTLVDVIELPEPVPLRVHFRRSLIPLLVSPMVFLGFMQSAQLAVETVSGFVLLLLLAFQNGFFWQTIINAKRA